MHLMRVSEHFKLHPVAFSSQQWAYTMRVLMHDQMLHGHLSVIEVLTEFVRAFL